MSRTLLMSFLGIVFSAVVPAGFANAYPLAKPGMTIQSFPPTFTANYDFEGIVSLSNCSGSLVRFENSKPSDAGMVLTNGHCLDTGFPAPGQVVYGRPSRVSFGLLNSKGQRIGTTTAKLVIYATMTKTDMTLYKLNESFQDIQTRTGIRPLTMSSTHPKKGEPIEIISGYWKRGFSCGIDTFIYRLVEGGWTNNDSIRYTQPGCETYGGTSGSPVIAAGTRTVIGVNNTGNESGGRCTENNPCEIDEKGNVTVIRDAAYGQQTYWVYSCLNSNYEVDLNVPGCLLPK